MTARQENACSGGSSVDPAWAGVGVIRRGFRPQGRWPATGIPPLDLRFFNGRPPTGTSRISRLMAAHLHPLYSSAVPEVTVSAASGQTWVLPKNSSVRQGHGTAG